MTLNPEEDGITHINVYSKGKTKLGQSLSNFAYSPFTLKEHGRFASVEAYWYWISTGKQHDHLRNLFGWKAKEEGKKLEVVPMKEHIFQTYIRSAIQAKLMQNKGILNELIDSSLPLTHYYVYGGKVVDAGYEWIIEFLEHIRKSCKDANWRPK